MKNIKKTFFVLILCLFILSNTIIFIFLYEENNSRYRFFFNEIIIDNFSPENSNSWSNLKEDGWVSGDGTIDSPYIIENVVFSNNGDAGLQIKNSDEYFIIKNCKFNNLSSTEKNSAIIFYNVSNGVFLENEVINNSGSGIKIQRSNNINISNNKISNNYKHGIHILQSNQITIENNDISFNGINEPYVNYHGIFVDSGNDNKIINNFVYYNLRVGIFISNNTGALIKNNFIHHNALNDGEHGLQDGLFVNYSDHSTITNNTAQFNGIHGLRLYRSNNNLINGNRFLNNPEFICNVQCENNTFLMNEGSILRTNNSNPKENETFKLYWDRIVLAKNFSLYMHTSKIYEINDSISLIDNNIYTYSYNVSDIPAGDYFFKIVAFLSWGNVSTTNLFITIIP